MYGKVFLGYEGQLYHFFDSRSSVYNSFEEDKGDCWARLIIRQFSWDECLDINLREKLFNLSQVPLQVLHDFVTEDRLKSFRASNEDQAKFIECCLKTKEIIDLDEENLNSFA